MARRVFRRTPGVCAMLLGVLALVWGCSSKTVTELVPTSGKSPDAARSADKAAAPVDLEKPKPATADQDTTPRGDQPAPGAGLPPSLVPLSSMSPTMVTGRRDVTETRDDGSRIVRRVKIYGERTIVNDGPYIEWYPGGESKYSEGNYADGKQVGLWRFWYEDGTLAKQGNYRDSKSDGVWTYYRVDGGKQREEHYADGKRHGKWLYWSDAGKLQRQEEYVAGTRNGSWLDWYPDGKVAHDTVLVDGQLDGVQKAYHPNGQLARLAEFKAGKRHGKIVTYNEQGKVESEVVYRNDTLVKTVQ